MKISVFIRRGILSGPYSILARSGRILLTAAICLFGVNNFAIADEPTAYFCGPENPPEARSLDKIIPALYSTVSGKAGSAKNWSLLKLLFSERAMVTPVFHDEQGGPTAKISTVDEFIALNKTIFKNQDFYEAEVNRKTFRHGHMANILSHYESRDAIGATPYAQGVNSFQLLNDGRRWCVISVTWDSHTAAHPLGEGVLDYARSARRW